MGHPLEQRPKLRPVEAVPLGDGRRGQFALHDPTGLSEAMLTVSEPALFILALFDGRHALTEVMERFQSRYGQAVREQTLTDMVKNLDRARLLEGEAFESHMNGLRAEYRAATVRASVYGQSLGDRDEVEAYLREMLPRHEGNANGDGRIVGLIAPHLDYPRGAPCYEKAYGRLHGRTPPDRCVILGTNHFGLSTCVVATSKSFATPLGVTETDVSFLESVERRCGHELRGHELDHRREHSVEIQVMCLQHLFGADRFKIVPFLCPDPCGPSGTRPRDGEGVDLREFAEALRDVIAESGGDTLVVAGADLSHVGSQFGDTFTLDPAFLRFLEERDRRALAHLESAKPEAFVEALAADENVTRVCSAGCMYVAAVVLRGACPTLQSYHQAFNPEIQICVTCAAITYAR